MPVAPTARGTTLLQSRGRARARSPLDAVAPVTSAVGVCLRNPQRRYDRRGRTLCLCRFKRIASMAYTWAGSRSTTLAAPPRP
jgi:hypothetical protein